MTAEAVLRRLQAEHGLVLRLGGRCPGGEVGAHFADGVDGRRYVFKWSTEVAEIEHLADVVRRVNGIRAIGYPAPEHFTPFSIPGAVVVLQEAVPGRWYDTVAAGLVGEALRLNDLQRGRGDGVCEWTEHIRTTLTHGAQGYCLHEPLRRHSPATRRLLEWIHDVGGSIDRLPETDLVHFDFHHRNMLRSGSQMAVVDWDGCRTGDRVFDLVTFCFGMTHADAAPGVEQHVWRRARELAGTERLAPYVAHMALRRVDWSIRHHPDEVDVVLALADRYRRAVC